MKEIFTLNRIPNILASKKDDKFTFKFWKALIGGMGVELNFSTTYHPKTD